MNAISIVYSLQNIYDQADEASDSLVTVLDGMFSVGAYFDLIRNIGPNL